MEDNASSKENVCELYINDNNIIDKYKKERIISNNSLKNKDEFIVTKNNSHINKNNNNKTFVNTIMVKPKNKSEIYQIKSNLMKFYNDLNGTKKFVINIPKIITQIQKSSFQPEEEKTKENIENSINNFSNMPSFTRMLRKALYSTSDISSRSMNSNNNSGNDHSSKGNS